MYSAMLRERAIAITLITHSALRFARIRCSVQRALSLCMT